MQWGNYITWWIPTLFLLAVGQAQSGSLRGAGQNSDLVIGGTVENVKVEPREDGTEVRVDITARLEYLNKGKRAVLVLKVPPPVCPGILVTKTEAPPQEPDILFEDYKGASFSGAVEWEMRRARLDEKNPPGDDVRLLEPGDSWGLESVNTFYLHVRSQSDGFGHAPVSWDSVQHAPALWIRLRCEMWPFNLERPQEVSKMKFGTKLQRRWRKIGFLQMDPIVSEAMSLSLKGVDPTAK